MSIEALSWAMKQNVGDPTTKLILIIISDHYNDSRGYAFPSQERLSSFAECSIRTIQRHIKTLLDLKFIGVLHTPNNVNKYTIPALEIVHDKLSHPKMGTTPVSHSEDDSLVIRTLNNSYNTISNKLDIAEPIKKSYGDMVYQDHLAWLKLQNINVRNHRTFISKLREIIKGNSDKIDNEIVYKELHNIFNEVRRNKKAELKEYLFGACKQTNERLTKPKERVLNDQAKALMESNYQKIYKATKGQSGWGGLDYLSIRQEYEKAFKEGSIIFSHTKQKATSDEILEYFVGVK